MKKTNPENIEKEDDQFQYIIRLLNTNINGEEKVMYGLTAIKGIGRRFAGIVCKRAGIDLRKRAGELTNEELDTIVKIIHDPLSYNIPKWFLNRQKDLIDGKWHHFTSNNLETTFRADLELMKKIKCHRGIRHRLRLRVRGQHTKTTGRSGRTVGVSKKKGG